MKRPTTAWQFRLNQNIQRKILIGPVDVGATKKVKKRMARQESGDPT